MGGGVGMLLGSGPHASRLEFLVLNTPIPSDGIKDPLGVNIFFLIFFLSSFLPLCSMN
jgi:hypothetical protein